MGLKKSNQIAKIEKKKRERERESRNSNLILRVKIKKKKELKSISKTLVRIRSDIIEG